MIVLNFDDDEEDHLQNNNKQNFKNTRDTFKKCQAMNSMTQKQWRRKKLKYFLLHIFH